MLEELDLSGPLPVLKANPANEDNPANEEGRNSNSGNNNGSSGSGSSGVENSSDEPKEDEPQGGRGDRGGVSPSRSTGKRSPLSSGRGGAILGVAHPFDRGKELVD